MKNTILIGLLFILVSCNSAKDYTNTVFEEIYNSQIGGKEEFGFEHITSNEDYLYLVERLNLQEVENDKMLELDFSKNDVVVIYLGQRNTGGYAIAVESMYWQDDILNIQTITTKPEKGENVTMVITTPYCIVSIPKAKEIQVYK